MKTTRLKHLWVLMATVFVDMLGLLMVVPIIPFYALDMGADALTVTLLTTAFAAAQLLSSPLWGRFSDLLGRRPMIIFGLLISAVGFLLFGFAGSLIPLFASRVVQGIGGGTTGVVQAYVSDVAPAGERAKALGWLTAATSAGVMIGPALGSLTAGWGQWAPGVIAAGLCLVNAAFAWWLLPESRQGSAAREAEGGKDGEEALRKPGSLASAIGRVLAHPGRPLYRLIWMYALAMMAFMGMTSIFPLFLEDRFGVDEKTIGWFFVYVGGLSLLMRALVLGPVVARLGEVRTLRLGATSLGLGFFAISFCDGAGLQDWESLVVLALAVSLVPIGTALLFPATTSQISGRAESHETGQTLGVQQAFGGMARMVGPALAGVFFRDLGVPTPLWLSSALLVLVLAISLGIHPRGDEAERTATRQAPVEAEGS